MLQVCKLWSIVRGAGGFNCDIFIVEEVCDAHLHGQVSSGLLVVDLLEVLSHLGICSGLLGGDVLHRRVQREWLVGD